MSVFVSRPMKIVTFLRKTVTSQNGLLIFLWKETHSDNKIMEIVEDFDETSYNNNGKPWKSSRILRVNPNFFIFLSFFIISSIFSHFSHFFIFFIFSNLFFTFLHFHFSLFFFIFRHFFIFLHFLSFHFLSFSVTFFHFLSCFFFFSFFLLFFLFVELKI